MNVVTNYRPNTCPASTAPSDGRSSNFQNSVLLDIPHHRSTCGCVLRPRLFWMIRWSPSLLSEICAVHCSLKSSVRSSTSSRSRMLWIAWLQLQWPELNDTTLVKMNEYTIFYILFGTYSINFTKQQIVEGPMSSRRIQMLILITSWAVFWESLTCQKGMLPFLVYYLILFWDI